MKPSELKASLKYAYDERLPVFVWGAPGIGKSDVVRQVATDLGIELIDKRLSQSDPTEMKGFPWADQKSGTMKFFRDDQLPTKGKGILFLDELNNAPQAVQAPAYQLILDRRLGSYELPPGWTVVAAGNRAQDRAITHAMSSALKNRFTHLDMEPDLEDWMQWAMAHDISHLTRGYLRWRQANFCVDKITPEMRAFPTPRAWVKVDRIMNNPSLSEAICHELIKGTVGEGVGLEYFGYARTEASLPDFDEILAKPTTVKVPTEPSVQYAVMARMEDITSAKNVDKIMAFATRLPQEFTAMLVKSFCTRDPKLTETPTIVKWLLQNHSVLAQA